MTDYCLLFVLIPTTLILAMLWIYSFSQSRKVTNLIDSLEIVKFGQQLEKRMNSKLVTDLLIVFFGFLLIYKPLLNYFRNEPLRDMHAREVARHLRQHVTDSTLRDLQKIKDDHSALFDVLDATQVTALTENNPPLTNREFNQKLGEVFDVYDCFVREIEAYLDSIRFEHIHSIDMGKIQKQFTTQDYSDDRKGQINGLIIRSVGFWNKPPQPEATQIPIVNNAQTASLTYDPR